MQINGRFKWSAERDMTVGRKRPWFLVPKIAWACGLGRGEVTDWVPVSSNEEERGRRTHFVVSNLCDAEMESRELRESALPNQRGRREWVSLPRRVRRDDARMRYTCWWL